jgi:hypothetical protein
MVEAWKKAKLDARQPCSPAIQSRLDHLTPGFVYRTRANFSLHRNYQVGRYFSYNYASAG